MPTVVPLSNTRHIWDDPSVPLTVPTSAGRRTIVDVATASGERPFGFAVNYDIEPGQVTVSWPGIVCMGDELTQYPVPAPAGPLLVAVISPT
jgi:hypothetical protein